MLSLLPYCLYQLCPLLRENFQDELNIPPVCLTSSASAHQQVGHIVFYITPM